MKELIDKIGDDVLRTIERATITGYKIKQCVDCYWNIVKKDALILLGFRWDEELDDNRINDCIEFLIATIREKIKELDNYDVDILYDNTICDYYETDEGICIWGYVLTLIISERN